jgi:hypothetical protein
VQPSFRPNIFNATLDISSFKFVNKSLIPFYIFFRNTRGGGVTRVIVIQNFWERFFDVKLRTRCSALRIE